MACSAGSSFFIERQRILKLCVKPSDSVRKLAGTPYKEARETKAALKELKDMDRDLDTQLMRCIEVLRRDEFKLVLGTCHLVEQTREYPPKRPRNNTRTTDYYAIKLESKLELLKDVIVWERDAVLRQQEDEHPEEKEKEKEKSLEIFRALVKVIDHSLSTLKDNLESSKSVSDTVPKTALKDSFNDKQGLTSLDLDPGNTEEENTAQQAINSSAHPILVNNTVAQIVEEDSAASKQALSISETRELLYQHTERYGYTVSSRTNGFRDGQKCADYAKSILEKRSRLAAVGTLVTRTSKAVHEVIPRLYSVPLRDWDEISTYGSREWMGRGRKPKYIHGGSPLTFECLNMEKMIVRQAKMEMRLREKKRIGRAKFLHPKLGS